MLSSSIYFIKFFLSSFLSIISLFIYVYLHLSHAPYKIWCTHFRKEWFCVCMWVCVCTCVYVNECMHYFENQLLCR